ncbi:MAG: hypothetical protein GY946_11190, partial [bacterium]|nr:hypothetical protein [bacterium]
MREPSSRPSRALSLERKSVRGPPIARERLKVLPNGKVYYRFKKAWRDGSRGIVMDGVEFVGKVAALIPRPQVNLVRYHGCFAPGSKIRGTVVRDRGRSKPPEPKAAPTGTTVAMVEARGAARPLLVRPRNYG